MDVMKMVELYQSGQMLDYQGHQYRLQYLGSLMDAHTPAHINCNNYSTYKKGFLFLRPISIFNPLVAEIS